MGAQTWDGFEKQMRYKINQSKDKFFFHDLDVDTFDEIYQMVFDRQGIKRPQSLEFNRKMSLTFGDKCRIYGLSYDGERLASAVLFLEDGNNLYYVLGATNPDYYSDDPNSVLLWNVFQEYPDHLLDFLGTNSESISRYKTGFGGQLRPYFGGVRV
jgi:lipid II:glycine glycyltransferase (peptidoglycan interpeptide bridge formation enzyme)